MKNLIPLALTLCPSLAIADAVNIVVDVAPVAALAQSVAGDSTTVTTLVGAAADPHTLVLRPSQIRTLQDADIIVATSPEMTPWLVEVLEAVVPDTPVLWLDHDHAEHADHEDEEKHDDHGHEDEGHKDEDHKDHDHEEDGHKDEDHKDDDHGDHEEDDHKDHADAEGDDHDDHAGHGDEDPHHWMDMTMLSNMTDDLAGALTSLRPDDAASLATSKAETGRAIADESVAFAAFMDTFGQTPVVVSHNAWPAVSEAFNLNVVGYMSDGHHAAPGPAHVAELQDIVTAQSVKCFVKDPAENDRTFAALNLPDGSVIVSADPDGAPAQGRVTILPALMDSLKGCHDHD